MTRAQRQLTIVIPLICLYFLMLAKVLPVPFISEATAGAILPVIPFWACVAFGAYTLSSLGLGLLRFRDCPEAYESLLAEISQAKDELRDKGAVKTDAVWRVLAQTAAGNKK